MRPVLSVKAIFNDQAARLPATRKLMESYG